MGGERSSTTRQPLSGKICFECRIPIPYDPNHRYGERHCQRCIEARAPKCRIYVHFMHNGGWYCRFLLPDLQTIAAPPRTYSCPAKVRELIERGHGFKDLADKQAFDYGVQIGRGSAWLNLTEDQYARLRGRI